MYDYSIHCEALGIPGGEVVRIKGSTGRPVKNQWLIETDQGTFFQSYNTIIAYRLKKKVGSHPVGRIFLDKRAWDISQTTARYRRVFLEEGAEETRAKLDSGVYKTAYLNMPFDANGLPLV